jgi:hypothetical protein
MIWYRHGVPIAGRCPTIVDVGLVRRAGEYPSPAIPHRSVRRPLGADRADAVGLASPTGRVGDREDTTRPAGDRERDPLRQPDRDRVGVSAARLPAVQDGVRLLPRGRRRGSRRRYTSCCVAGSGARRVAPRSPARRSSTRRRSRPRATYPKPRRESMPASASKGASDMSPPMCSVCSWWSW